MPSTQEQLKEIRHKLAGLDGRLTKVRQAVGNHNLLSATHPDTDSATPPARGSIIRGSAANEWEEHGLGAAGRYLRSDGNDALWTVFGVGDLPAHKDTHDPEDGSDKLDCAAPSELAGVQAAAEGSAHEFARADHAHQIQHSIADNHLVTIDGAAAANNYAKFTASGLLGRTYAQVLADLSAQAGAAFDWNAQNLTNIGTVGCGDITATNIDLDDKMPETTTRARAYLATADQSVGTGAWTRIDLNAETYDDGGDFDHTVNHRYVAPVDGYYLCCGAIRWQATDGSRFSAGIDINGTIHCFGQLSPGADNDLNITAGADVIKLAVGDTVELHGHQDSGVNKLVRAGSANTYLSVHLISVY